MRLAGGERPPRLALVGVGVGFLGVAFLFHPEGGATWWGIAVTGVSALAWAAGSYLSGRLAAARGRARRDDVRDARRRADPAARRARPAAGPRAFSGKSLAAFVYLVVAGSLIGYTAYVWLLHHVPLGTVATYAYVNPVVAITLGVLFLDESLTTRVLVGAAIVAGVGRDRRAHGDGGGRRAVRGVATRSSRPSPAAGRRSPRRGAGARRPPCGPRPRSPASGR